MTRTRGPAPPECTHPMPYDLVPADPRSGAAVAGREITLPFTPGDSLRIDIPGTVTYRPGDKAEAVVRGDPELIGHVRIDGRRVTSPGHPLKLGDVLTLALAHATVLVRIVALGARRGPYEEARTLYQRLDGGGDAEAQETGDGGADP